MEIKKSAIAMLAAADILAFPFLRPLPITLSMVPVLMWSAAHLIGAKKTKENLAILIFLASAVVSVLLSLLVLPSKTLGQDAFSEAMRQNIAYLYLMVVLFSYYYLLSTAIKSWSFEPQKLIRIYYYFNFALAVLFWVDFQAYFSVRSIWTFSGGLETADELSSIVRFTGIFSDPNNGAIASIALYCYLCLYDRSSGIRTAVYTLMCLVVIVASMSSTGFLAFGLVLGAIFIFGAANDDGTRGRRIGRLLLVMVLCLGIGVTLSFISETEVGQLALTRLSENSADSRVEKIKQAAEMNPLEYLFWGDGGTIYLDSSVFRPHVGHLHLVYNYGIVAYFCFLFSVFRLRRRVKRIYYLPLLPIFLGFSANTGFIDFRFTSVVALLLAVYATTPAPGTARSVGLVE